MILKETEKSKRENRPVYIGIVVVYRNFSISLFFQAYDGV